METWLTHITEYLLKQSWQIAILVAVIAAVTLALKNKSAHVRYLLWLIILAKCLVPPLLTMPLAVLPVEQLSTPSPASPFPTLALEFDVAEAPKAEIPTRLRSFGAMAPATLERAPELTLRQWLGLVWATGVATLLLFVCAKALRANRWLRWQRAPLPTGLQCAIEDLFSDLGVRKSPKVWLLEGIGQPFVWGLLRGGIYIPTDFVKADSAEHRRQILVHELSHILRFDAAVNLLQILAQAAFWFHPLVWWANRRIRVEREKCCDEMAIAQLGGKAKDYSTAIVNVLVNEYESTQPVPSLAIAGPVRNVEERIKTIMKPGKRFLRRPSLVVVTITLLLALLTVPTVFVLTARAGTGPEAPMGGSVTDGKGDDTDIRAEELLQRFAAAIRNMPEVFAIEAKLRYLIKTSKGSETEQIVDLKFYRNERCIDVEDSGCNYPVVGSKTDKTPDSTFYQRSVVDRKNRAFHYDSQAREIVPRFVVFWSDGKKRFDYMKRRIGVGMSLEGHVAHDAISLTELLCQKACSLRYEGLEDVDGSPCHVLEAATENHGSYTLWLDQQANYLPRKISVTKKVKDIFGGTPVSDVAGGSVAEVSDVMESVKFRDFDGVLLPVGSKTRLIWKYTNGETAEWHGEHEWVSVDLDPDFKALNAFKPDVPDGTRINHQDFVGTDIRFEWRNGEVKREQGVDMSETERPSEDKTRVVRFPEDRSLGVLYTRDSRAESWEELGQARGAISISRAKELRLIMSAHDRPEDVARLASLGADDIQVLHVHCHSLRDSDMVHLKGLTGLQELRLVVGMPPGTGAMTGKGLVNLRGMSSLRWLSIECCVLSDEGLIHLRYLTNLESLRLYCIKEVTGKGLAYVKDLPLLHSIVLQYVPVEDVGIVNLKAMHHLERLTLQDTKVTDEGLAHLGRLTGLKHLSLPPETTDAGLAHLKGLNSLEELNLSGTRVTDDGLIHLKDLPRLRSLRIGSGEITGRGLSHLRKIMQLQKVNLSLSLMNDAGSKGLKGLTSVQSLRLKNAPLTDAGMANLKGLASLETLDLDGTEITEEGLVNLGGLSSLRKLVLRRTAIGNRGLAYLGGLKSLETLNLNSTAVTDDGLRNLKELSSLQYLSLNNTNISGEGLASLKDMRALRDLHVCVSHISETGLRHLKEMTWLRELRLEKGTVDARHLQDLVEALPDCTIKEQKGILWYDQGTVVSLPKRKPVPPSLKGRVLPDLQGIKIDFAVEQADNEKILVCFWDMLERPSRSCIVQLAQQAEELRRKGITVVAIQTSKVDKNELDAWVKKNRIPFPVGLAQGDETKIRSAWGVKSLPWLILTDHKHVVAAEGFGPGELDAKIVGVGPSANSPGKSDKTIVRGQAVDPNGRPLAQIPIVTYGYHERETVTGRDGRFTFELPLKYQHRAGCLIVARDRKRNLAAFHDFEGQRSPIIMKLQPAVVLAGRICDSQGNSIQNVNLRLYWRLPRDRVSYERTEHAEFDKNGRFEIRGIPYKRSYHLDVSARGYGRGATDIVDTNGDDARIQLPPLVLRTADQSVGGTVLDLNGNPVVGAKVSAGGEGQPWPRTQSDKKGRFLIKGVCAGAVTVSGRHTEAQTLISGNIEVQAGDTDVRLILDEYRLLESSTPAFESLMGNPLPDITNLGLTGKQIDAASRQILICCFDMQQRPARRCVIQLARQIEQLKRKGVAVVAVQASKVDERQLREWTEQNKIPFPVGVIPDGGDEIRSAWGVQALPWLILTDGNHIVSAEGFALEELDEKIKAVIEE